MTTQPALAGTTAMKLPRGTVRRNRRTAIAPMRSLRLARIVYAVIAAFAMTSLALAMKPPESRYQLAQFDDEVKAFISEQREQIFNDPDAPVGGNPTGDVTIVEFFDYNCPYCRLVAPTL